MLRFTLRKLLVSITFAALLMGVFQHRRQCADQLGGGKRNVGDQQRRLLARWGLLVSGVPPSIQGQAARPVSIANHPIQENPVRTQGSPT
jgi:hypothetical protein